MQRLLGNVAIVTGASGGIGSAEVALFLKEGARVVATDVDRAGLDQLKDACVAHGNDLTVVPHDVTSEEDWHTVVEAAVAAYGKVDILVNTAGFFDARPLEGLGIDAWQAALDVNVTGVLRGCLAVVPRMIAGGGGAIVNTSSLAGSRATSIAHYGAAKAALSSLTRDAAAGYAKHGIRVNAVIPGLIDTPMTAGVLGTFDTGRIPMSRCGQPIEIAYGVLFLVSREASYVTGAELVIDGGFNVF